MIEEILFTIIILGCWSIVYRRTPIFTIWVQLQIGVMLAFTIYTSTLSLNRMVFTPYWAKGILLTAVSIPAILGFLSWLRLHPNRTARAVARWPVAALGGIAAGTALKGVFGPMILKQLVVTMPKDPVGLINTFIMAVSTFTVLSHFLFTFPRMTRGPLGYITKSGRYIIMVAFGVQLASFIMTTAGYAVSYMRDFIRPPYVYVTATAGILILADIIYHKLR